MCAFHHSRQSGSLFEKQGGIGQGVCFSQLTTSYVHIVKNTKVSEWRRNFNIEELGKFDEVVLRGLVSINAIRVRF